jgi:hypothetical protein
MKTALRTEKRESFARPKVKPACTSRAECVRGTAEPVSGLDDATRFIIQPHRALGRATKRARRHTRHARGAGSVIGTRFVILDFPEPKARASVPSGDWGPLRNTDLPVVHGNRDPPPHPFSLTIEPT